jgi:Zn ribbon nucleic-acid-binding protein
MLSIFSKIQPISAILTSHRFFSQGITLNKNTVATADLLRHVTEGKQDAAEKIVQRKPELGLCQGDVTDPSQRHFKKISPFIYSVWALDWDMWSMMLKYLPKDGIQTQLRELEEQGTSHGQHFDFQELIETQQVYLDNFDTWSCEQLGIQWCVAIGTAQKNAPAHVGNQYCREDQSFIDPDFTKPLLSRRLDLVDGSSFFPLGLYPAGELGKDFAVFRWNKPAAGIGTMKPCPNARITSITDLKALIKLRDTRLEQLEELKSLYNPSPRLQGG